MGRRDGNIGARESGDDTVFPGHVVGTLQDVAQGRTAQDVLGTGLIREAIGEVRVPPGDQRKLQRWPQAGYLANEPIGHARGIDAFDAAVVFARRHGNPPHPDVGKSTQSL